MIDMFDLKGKNAMITGASQGLGKGMAIGLAKAGANIIIVDLKVPSEVIKEIKSYNVDCYGYEFNLRDFDSYDSLIEKINNECGHIDILINNAGVQKRSKSEEFPRDDWEFVMDINCNAVFYMCQKVGKLMLEKGYGKIINMASMLSFQGGYTVPAYAAAKGAVATFTKSLSNEWASRGVNVNCIAPGYMATTMNTQIIDDKNRNKQILERIPANRWGKPEDLAGTAVFLSSHASDYINGYIIAVDGGWLGR